MRQGIDRLPAFDEARRRIHVIIETAKGGHVKYSYQPEMGMFYAKRLLPPGMVFPFNFGFVPSTLGDDGDPLDVLLLNDVPLVCGSLVKAALLAVVKAEQTEDGKTFRNDRLVGAMADEESPPEFLKLDLDSRAVAEIQFFFSTYNRFSGKEFKVVGIGDERAAHDLVRQGELKFVAGRPKESQTTGRM